MSYLTDKDKFWSESYDVIIVGGGLAGCVAAQYAVKNGAKAIVFERDKVIGQPVRCGEGVSERGIKPYVSLDGPWIANKLKCVEFVAPDGESIKLKTDLIAYILDRTKFDKHLGDKAAKLGADIVLESDVTGLIYDDGKPSGVKVLYKEKEYAIKGKIIIGADGVESRVGRWAGLKTMTKFNNLEAAAQVVVSGLSIDPAMISLYFGREVAPGGYAWIFPKNAETANVGLGISGNYSREKSAEEYLEDFLKKVCPDAKYSKVTAGGVPCNPPLKKMATDNVIVAGDAGHAVNPLTGAGIATALCSGRIAGEVAAEAVQNGHDADSIVQSFTKKWYRSRGRDMKRFNRLKEFVQKLDDEKFNELAQLLKGTPKKDWSMLKIFIFALKNKPELIIDAAKVYRDF